MSDLDSLLSQASSSWSVLSPGVARVPSTSSAASPASPVAARGRGGLDDVPSGGRFSRGGLSLKSYSVISVCGSDHAVCFGSVGVGNASFCVRRHCAIKSHVDAKVDAWGAPERTRVFIVQSPGSTVFAEPSIGLEQVPKAVWTSWQSQQLTLTEWKREFCAVEIANDAFASIDEIKEEASFLIKAKDFRTPSKRVRESTTVSSELHKLMDLASNDFVTHTRLLPVVDESGEETVDELDTSGRQKEIPGGLTNVVSKVESSVVAVGEALGVLAEQTHNRFVDVSHEAKLVAGAVHTLSSSIGVPVELDDRFEAPTLWGTTAFIADEMVRLSKDVLAVELGVRPLQAEMEWVRAEMRGVKDTEEAASKISKIIVLVMKRLQAITPELEEVKGRLGLVEDEVADVQRERKRAKHGHEESQIGGRAAEDPSMDDLLKMLHGNTLASGSRESLPTSRRLTLEGTSAASDESADQELTTRLLKELVAEVGLLKSCAQDDSVKFGGMGLRSIQECQEWIHENFSCYRYGLMMDPLLMLDRICGDDRSGSKKNQFKTWESRVKLKITTGAEEAALQAIAYKRPFLFHTGKTAMVSERNKSKLDQIPTFAAWKSGGEGVRNYIVKQMNLTYNTMNQEIAFALGRTPEFSTANALAIRSLNDTITFIT